MSDQESDMMYRYSHALDFLLTAIHLSEEVKDIENEYSTEESPDELKNGSTPLQRANRYSITSVINVVTYLEAVINEFYDDLIYLNNSEYEDRRKIIEGNIEEKTEIFDEGQYSTETGLVLLDCAGKYSGIDIDEEHLNIVWKVEEIRGDSFRQLNFIDKYQLLLAYFGEEPFASGEQPLQEIRTIRRLRNYFIHNEPVTMSYTIGDSADDHRLGSALKGKFELNSIAPKHSPYFPIKCLGHGCTEWCINSSLAFTEMFFNKFGIEPPYSRDGMNYSV